MNRTSRSLVTLLLGLLAVGLAAGTAGASQVAFSPGGSITMEGPLTVTPEGQASIRCNVTLRGTITSALVGVGTGETLGTIRESTISGCSGGIFTLLLPIGVRVAEVLHRTPEVLAGVLLQLESTGVLIQTLSRCLYGTRFGVLYGLVYEPPGYYTLEGEWLRSPSPLVRNLGVVACVLTASMSGPLTLTRQRMTYLP